jgi:hypothetical protein
MSTDVVSRRSLHYANMHNLSRRSIGFRVHGRIRRGCWQLYGDDYDERAERHENGTIHRYSSACPDVVLESNIRFAGDCCDGLRGQLLGYYVQPVVYSVRSLLFHSDMFDLEWDVDWKLHGRLRRGCGQLYGDCYDERAERHKHSTIHCSNANFHSESNVRRGGDDC